MKHAARRLWSWLISDVGQMNRLFAFFISLMVLVGCTSPEGIHFAKFEPRLASGRFVEPLSEQEWNSVKRLFSNDPEYALERAVRMRENLLFVALWKRSNRAEGRILLFERKQEGWVIFSDQEADRAARDSYGAHGKAGPNKSPEPTACAVTPRAIEMKSEKKKSNFPRSEARVAPSQVVAHL